MKIKTTIKKIGAVTASALLIGTTLGAAGTLGDFPLRFVEQDGNPNTSIVVGSGAAAEDIVGAVNIGTALGQETIRTETREHRESVEVETRRGWEAERGVTLNRPNRNLYLDSTTKTGINTLIDDDLDLLRTTEFEDHRRDLIEVEHELVLGNSPQDFSHKRGMDEIGLHLDISEGNVFSLEAMFESSVDFTHQEMEEEEIELFGTYFQVSDRTTENRLVLYGDSERYDIETDREETITVDGNSHTVHIRYVDGNSATAVIDGETRRLRPGDTIRLSGQDVRIRDIFPLGDDEGIVSFGIGSERLELENNRRIRIDGSSVDGTNVVFNGDPSETGAVENLEDIIFEYQNLGRSERFIEKVDFYRDPMFGIELHYGGPEPDAETDSRERVEFEADGNSALVDFTTDRDRAGQIVFLDEDEPYRLGDFDGKLMTYEGQELELDDYMILNEDETANLYQITDLFFDGNRNEGEIEFENLFTGATDTLEFDGTTRKTARINRVDYTFEFTETAGDNEKITVRWGEEDNHVIYPNLYTETDSALAFTDTVDLIQDVEAEFGDTIRLPSTKSSGDLELEIYERNVDNPGTVTSSNNRLVVETGSSSATYDSVSTIGGLEYYFDVQLDSSGNPENIEVTLSDQDSGTSRLGPSAALIQPEDNRGNEYGFVVNPTNTGDIEFDDIYGTERSGFGLTSFRDTRNLDATYSYYGTYIELDTDDEGLAEFNIPGSESTVGMAITEYEGELTPTGTATDQEITFEYEGITGEDFRGRVPETGKLDTEISRARMEENNLILVGGPAINTLVEDLAEEGRTRTAQEWRDHYRNEALLQIVPDAFASGRYALIVAGYEAEDTRAASRYLAKWEDYRDELDTRELSLTSDMYPR